MTYPKLVVEAGFGFAALDTVTSWTDVTGDVRSVAFTRGRQHVTSIVEAGTATLVVDNNDGDWRPQNTASTYSPDVDIGVPIRVSAVYSSVTYRLFYGTIEDIQLSTGGMTDHTATVTCADVFSLLARSKPGKRWTEIVPEYDPRGWWEMSDLTDSSTEGDHTLTLIGSPDTGEAGVWTGDKAMQFNGSTQYASIADGASDLDIVGDLTLVAWINPDTGATPRSIIARGPYYTHGYNMYLYNGGLCFSHSYGVTFPFVTSVQAMGTVPNDEWSMVAVVRSQNTVTGYVNGVQTGSGTLSAATNGSNSDTTIGGNVVATFDGHISEAVIWDTALTDDDIATLYNARGPAYPSQATGTRISSLATDAGIPATSIDTGKSTMSAFTGSPTSYLTAMLQAVDTEFGHLYVASDGTLTFKDRHFRIEDQTTSTATVGDSGDFSYHHAAYGIYSATLYNEIRVTPSGGQPVVTTDDTSAALYGTRTKSVTIYPADTGTADTGTADNHGRFIVAQTASPDIRVAQVKFRLGNDDTALPTILNAELGDRYTVVQALEGDDLNTDVFLEQVTYKIAPKDWVVTWDLSPAAPQTAFWVLDSASRSQLGSTTTLSY